MVCRLAIPSKTASSAFDLAYSYCGTNDYQDNAPFDFRRSAL